MKNLILFLAMLIGAPVALRAGESSLSMILGPSSVQCCFPTTYRVEVTNINPAFPLEGVKGIWKVYRNGEVIYEFTNEPVDDVIEPSTMQSFVVNVPGGIFGIDGGLAFEFRFEADFDLNSSPVRTRTAEVAGCGITKEEGIEVVLDLYETMADDLDSYIFFYGDLLKPSTFISDGTGKDISILLDAYTWLAMIFDPCDFLDQEIIMLLLNSNTLEVEMVSIRWPPLVNSVQWYPDKDDEYRISGGDLPAPMPPPQDLTVNMVPSEPNTDVAALLIGGVDPFNPDLQEAMHNNVELMRWHFTSGEFGPRLPESNVMVRQVKQGYNTNQLLADLASMQDIYKEIYFFYSGNATADGKICLGTTYLDFMDWNDYLDAFFATGAETLHIVLDASHAGSLIDFISIHSGTENVDLDIVTSSNAEKTSSIISYDIGGEVQSYGKYSAQVFWALSNPAADANNDGEVSLLEAFEFLVDMNLDDIVNEQCPMSKSIRNHTFQEKGNLLREATISQYGLDFVNTTSIHFNPYEQPANSLVRSFDEASEYLVPVNHFLGWIEPYVNAFFSKPVIYAIMNAATGQIDFHEGNTFWPTLPGNPDYNPFDPEHVYQSGTDYLTGMPLNTIQQQASTSPEPNPNHVAYVVTGYHPDPKFQAAIIQTGEAVISNLMNEEHGDRYHPDDIRHMHCPTGDDLADAIAAEESLGQFAMIFIGNSTKTHLVTGKQRGDWMDFLGLNEKLGETGASDFKIYIEGSRSGGALDEISPNSRGFDPDFDLITGSNANSLAYVDFYVDEQMNMTGALTSTAYHFLQQYGNPDAESDGQAGISWIEAFQKMYKDNPLKQGSPLFQLSQPLQRSRRNFLGTGTTKEDYAFRGIDLNLRVHQRSSVLNITASQEFNNVAQSFSSSDVFEIAPLRRWDLEGIWEVDPSLSGDLLFHYSEDFDSLSAAEGINGLVSRLDTTQEWEAYYPSEYDDVEKIITAINVTEPREWAIAKVRETVGVGDEIEGINDLCVFPNPVLKEELHLELNLDRPSRLSIRIVNLNGQIIHAETEKLFPAGGQTISITMAGQPSGWYIAEVSDGHHSMPVPFVLK